MNREADIFLPRQKGYIVLDIESQGYVRFCPIEISAVRFSPEGRYVDSFSSLVRPRVRNVSPYITRLTGITSKMVRGAPLPAQVFAALREFVGDSVIVGHAVGENDIPIVNHFYHVLFGEEFSNPYVDTFYWAQRLFPDFGTGHYNLKALAEHFCISAENFHRAEADCRTTARLYQILCETAEALSDAARRKILHEFAHKNDPKEPEKTRERPAPVDYNALPVYEAAGDSAAKTAVIKLWCARGHTCMELRFPGGISAQTEAFMEHHTKCGWQEYPGGLCFAERMPPTLAVELMIRLRRSGYSLYRKDGGTFAGLEDVRPRKTFGRRRRTAGNKSKKSPASSAGSE